jgi:hypothetical protein
VNEVLKYNLPGIALAAACVAVFGGPAGADSGGHYQPADIKWRNYAQFGARNRFRGSGTLIELLMWM